MAGRDKVRDEVPDKVRDKVRDEESASARDEELDRDRPWGWQVQGESGWKSMTGSMLGAWEGAVGWE
jgi:hypothetical protein